MKKEGGEKDSPLSIILILNFCDLRFNRRLFSVFAHPLTRRYALHGTTVPRDEKRARARTVR